MSVEYLSVSERGYPAQVHLSLYLFRKGGKSENEEEKQWKESPTAGHGSKDTAALNVFFSPSIIGGVKVHRSVRISLSVLVARIRKLLYSWHWTGWISSGQPGGWWHLHPFNIPTRRKISTFKQVKLMGILSCKNINVKCLLLQQLPHWTGTCIARRGINQSDSQVLD